MATLARFVLRHRRLVVLAWLLAFLAGSLGAQKAIDRLSFDFSLPGQAGYETSVKVLKTYGTASQDPPYLLVVSAPPAARCPKRRRTRPSRPCSAPCRGCASSGRRRPA